MCINPASLETLEIARTMLGKDYGTQLRSWTSRDLGQTRPCSLEFRTNVNGETIARLGAHRAAPARSSCRLVIARDLRSAIVAILLIAASPMSVRMSHRSESRSEGRNVFVKPLGFVARVVLIDI